MWRNVCASKRTKQSLKKITRFANLKGTLSTKKYFPKYFYKIEVRQECRMQVVMIVDDDRLKPLSINKNVQIRMC